MNEIEISVVMPVFNEQDSLKQTMQSILDQDGIKLELIVIDDGSTDNSRKILDQFVAQDRRVVIISQENQGITKALINGCHHAKADFIARQDAGDWSLPGRLQKQLELLRARPNIVLSSTGSRYFSERGELLFEAHLSSQEARQGIKANSLDSIKGPSHHGCTMFRRDAYEKVGGYRADFLVAQDLDLWTRLSSFGEHVALPQVYYEAVLRKNAISSRQRELQEFTRQFIFECAQLRKKTGNDAGHLDLLKEKIANLASEKNDPSLEYNYFVGSVLLNNKSAQSRFYFKEALKHKPWHIKSRIKLLSSYF